jgi:hypothetical protein
MVMPALLILALAAGLGSEPPASAAPPAKAKAAKEEVVCTYESQPDSHFKKRVCLTRAQREARAAQERNNLMSSQRAFCTGSSC